MRNLYSLGPGANLAARLAELATHGDIYLGEETASRVRQIFQLQELGKYHIKNIQEPIVVYTVCLDKHCV